MSAGGPKRCREPGTHVNIHVQPLQYLPAEKLDRVMSAGWYNDFDTDPCRWPLGGFVTLCSHISSNDNLAVIE